MNNKKIYLSLTVAILLIVIKPIGLTAQNTYNMDITGPNFKVMRGHLDLGGSSTTGETIEVNNFYIERNNLPFFPVIGEFHYSRFPSEFWEEEILKMKSGGINVLATYVFWNIHERQEGKFDWSEDLNLGKFLELVKKHELYAIVRLGPFCHGEMRNGGIPDWMYGRNFEVRSNDPEYLNYVSILYDEIAKQINPYLFKDGGPVIGVQLENEFQHSAAPWEFTYPGSEKEYTVADLDAALAHEQITVTDGKNPRSEYGKKHMANLKEIAKKHGIDVPLYTATGWGNASIVEKGSLPVTAGYAYPFWSKPEPSDFYLFKDIRKYPDYSPISYDTDLYPSIACEIGPGIQPKFSRRPIVPYESVNPLMVRIVGSGSNGIGYYMYHGGSTPQFDGKFYNEEVNGLPRVNYDFQAPIGQYGQVRYHYKHLRMLHLFLDSYGEILAPMKTRLPETNAAITPDDLKTLRYAVRSYDNSGFLFIINFQDHLEARAINDVSIKIKNGKETLSFPTKGTFNIPKATSAILPFNLTLEEATLISATVQPLTILKREEANYYVFSSINGIASELNFSPETTITKLKNASILTNRDRISVKAKSDAPYSFTANGINFLILPHKMAMNAVKIKNELFISEALILEDQAKLQLISTKPENLLHIFPDRNLTAESTSASLNKEKLIFSGFGSYTLSFKEIKPEITFTKLSARKYEVQLKSDLSNLNDVFVNIDYVGDRGMAFINGEMITDHFYQGRKWELGLKSFTAQLKENKMIIIFHPMYSTYPYLKDLEYIPEFENDKYFKVNSFEVVPEYKAIIALN